MSIINNGFLSLSSKIKLQKQVVKEQKEEVVQKEPEKQETAPQRQIPSPVPQKTLNNDFLLTYRGITINHMATAETKTVVSDAVPQVYLPLTSKTVEPEPKPATVAKSVINQSSISSDYKNGVSRKGTSGFKNSSKLEAVKDMARTDLNAVANAIKAQLRKELGSDYDEESVQSAIKQAIEETIKLFSDNEKSRKSGGTEAFADEQAFVFKKSGLFGLRGRYVYNVQALTNTFVDKYNSITKTNFEEAQKLKKEYKDSPKVTNSVILKSPLGDDYKNAVTKESAKGTKSTTLNKIQSMATADLNAISDALKKQVKEQLGENYNEKLVQEAINEAIEKTISQFTDNKSSVGRSTKASTADNGFVYSKKGIFGLTGTYSYNVQSLGNTFIENYNSIIVKKQEKSTAVNEKKAELLEKKEEIKASYSLSSNYMTFNSNFDKAFEKALDSLNTDNYKNADEIISKSLNDSLVNWNCKNSGELQGRLDKLLTSTAQNYHEMYCPSISDSDFAKLFNNAKNEILSSVNDKTGCDIKDVTNSFDSAVLQAVNVYASSSSAPAATRSTASTGKITVSGEYFNFHYTPSDDKSSTGKISFYSKGVTYSINVNATSYLSDVGISHLLNMLKDLKPDIVMDLVKEANTIDIVNKLPGDKVNPAARAAADARNGKIYFVYDPSLLYHNEEFNSFSQTIIAHEIGHLIDSLHNSNSNQSTDNMELYWKLEKLLPEKEFTEKYYGFTNVNEFFAEYYAYKMCGDTDNNFNELLTELKSCKKINEIKEKNGVDKKTIKEEAKAIKDTIDKITSAFDKIIKETRKQPDKNRNDAKKTNNEQQGNLPSVEIPGIMPSPTPEPKPETDNDDIDNNKKTPDNETPVKPSRPQENPPAENNKDDEGKTQGEKPSKEPDSPNNQEGFTNDIDTGLNVNNIKDNPSKPNIEGGSITNPEGKDEKIQNALDNLKDYYTEQAKKEALEKYGTNANVKITVDVTVDANGNVKVNVDAKVLGYIDGDGKGGPKGDITGNTGAGEIDRGNTPGLDENGKIPVDKPGQEPSKDSGNTDQNTGVYEGVGIDVKDYMHSDGKGGYFVDTDSLVRDWQKNGGEVYGYTGKDSINDVLDDIREASSTGNWDNFWNNQKDTSDMGLGKYDNDYGYNGYGPEIDGDDIGKRLDIDVKNDGKQPPSSWAMDDNGNPISPDDEERDDGTWGKDYDDEDDDSDDYDENGFFEAHSDW